MSWLFVLFEHAAGYSVFRIKEFEEVAMFLPIVEASTKDVSKFKTVVRHIAFHPFKTAANALDNVNSISEGVLHEDLHLFLESCLPETVEGQKKIQLGVADSKIGSAIFDALGVKCVHTGVVPEILRGIRLHFSKLVDLSFELSSKAQLGLGHSYSRAKVKFNVNRVDNMVIQSINLLELLDKDINTFTLRLKEWYSCHFPELARILSKDILYAKVVKFIKDRKDLTENSLTELEEIVMDSSQAREIFDAAKSSMGMDLSPIDLITIQLHANRVVSLCEYRIKLQSYLKDKMDIIAPNLSVLVNETIAAKLISLAGSLMNLAKYPASTVQILGAEKALFRAIKNKTATPKYGVIYNTRILASAAGNTKVKGRISRYLASKCALATRIDCFSDVQTKVYGEKLLHQVEQRLKFYKTGEVYKISNEDVMKEAMVEVALETKKREKKMKRKAEEAFHSVNGTDDIGKAEIETPEACSDVVKNVKKKKLKGLNKSPVKLSKKKNSISEESAQNTSLQESAKKKKKKWLSEESVQDGSAQSSFQPGSSKKMERAVSQPSVVNKSFQGTPQNKKKRTKRTKKFNANLSV